MWSKGVFIFVWVWFEGDVYFLWVWFEGEVYFLWVWFNFRVGMRVDYDWECSVVFLLFSVFLHLSTSGS